MKTQQPFEYIGDKLQGNYVIIDDVYTTGRTLYYAQELLLKNGASRVCSVTLAR
ncbi:phosphoribosyltransferase family protein [Ligilactobacillus salivarius]